MKKLFGTDGIRGKANRYPMTPEVALSLGEAIATYFAQKKGGGKIVIGKDTRRSSYMFEYALSAGISSMGSQAILTGPLPTPGIAYLTKAMRADAGVMISASHNSFDDNGIKFFDQNGFKLPDEVEVQMESFLFSPHDDSIKPTGGDIGRAIRIEDAVGRYNEFLKSTFPKDMNLEGLKIVIDCANGAGYDVGPLVLEEMGASVIAIGNQPNGTNINLDCGALHPEGLCKRVVEEGAHLGIALDGDADRLILVDEKGKTIDGDEILALLAKAYQKENRLLDSKIVGTIMSNMGLQVYLESLGVELLRTAVGDRKIIELMREKSYSIGGEPSGHLILWDLSTTGDALLVALQVLSIMLKSEKPLSEIAHPFDFFPQESKNIPVKEKKDLNQIEALKKEIAEVEAELNGHGRVILRYSGTEPLIRLMIEANDKKLITKNIERLSSTIQTHL